MEVLKHFGTEHGVWVFLSDLCDQNVSKYFKQVSLKHYT